jgi:hypothetical protein
MTGHPSAPAHEAGEILYGSRIVWCEILNPDDRGLMLLAPRVQDMPEMFTLRIVARNTEHLARIVLRKKAEEGIVLLVSLLEPKD